MNRLILLLGGNMGDRFRILTDATLSLETVFGRAEASSSLYLTEPWGMKEQPWFLNACLTFHTSMNPIEVLERTRQVEKDAGRTRSEKWGPRSLDIDILDFGGQSLQSPDLVLPHPELHHRRFVLIPLIEAVPDWKHPVLGSTVNELLHSCPASEKVIRL